MLLFLALLGGGGASPAWAGPPPPVPAPPAPYRVPPWPVPTPGGWQQASSPLSKAADSRPTGTADPRPKGTAHPRPKGTAHRMVAAVNQSRADADCPPVRLNAALTRAAEAHSAHMARQGRLTHTGAGSSTPAERVRAAGYRARSTAENIAAGQDTPEAAVRAWVDSSAHRESLLTCDFTHVGVGAESGGGGPWWTLDLAARR
ncbi:CAP domain-containing protein [Streptomyces sp. NPDC003006]